MCFECPSCTSLSETMPRIVVSITAFCNVSDNTEVKLENVTVLIPDPLE